MMIVSILGDERSATAPVVSCMLLGSIADSIVSLESDILGGSLLLVLEAILVISMFVSAILMAPTTTRGCLPSCWRLVAGVLIAAKGPRWWLLSVI